MPAVLCYVVFCYAGPSSLHAALLHCPCCLTQAALPSCCLDARLWRMSSSRFPQCCSVALPHFPYACIANFKAEVEFVSPHSCHGFLFCCLATSQMCAALLHQLSIAQCLNRDVLCMWWQCHWQDAGFSGSATAVVCSKFLTCFMLLCSYYINPLSWTLYGIIVTQLGDETNLVSDGNQPEICCPHTSTRHCTL